MHKNIATSGRSDGKYTISFTSAGLLIVFRKYSYAAVNLLVKFPYFRPVLVYHNSNVTLMHMSMVASERSFWYLAVCDTSGSIL